MDNINLGKQNTQLLTETEVREDFNNLLTKLHSETEPNSIIEIVCEWFVKQVTEQWFYHCNTRVVF